MNGIKFNLLINKYGVAQDSTLGPLLFSLYINDLPYSINCKPLFFADDTCLVYSSPTPSMQNTAINQDLQNISIWFKANKLTLNSSISNVLTINPKISKAPPILNVTLNQSNSVKYLGMIIAIYDISAQQTRHRSNSTQVKLDASQNRRRSESAQKKKRTNFAVFGVN